MSGLTTINAFNASGEVTSVASSTVNLADIENIATNRVLGRTATGTGAVSAIQVDVDMLASNAVSTAKIANDAVTSAKIADDAVVQAAIADNAVNEARLQISNTGSNGQFLQKQSGNTGGLTWATAGGGNNNTSTTVVGAYAMVGATNPINTNVGTGTSFSGNSSTYQYGGVTGGTNNFSLDLTNPTIARNGNIPAGTWHFRGAGGQNTARCTLAQRTA